VKLLRNHPIFFGIMAVLLAGIGVEAWWLRSIRNRERQLEQEIGVRITEIERLHRQRPAPNEANLRAVRRDFNANARVLATMLQVLNVTGPEDLEYFAGEPQTRTDAFFDIATFIDRMRTAALEAGISMREDERFGFAEYIHEGPEPELIRPVYRQRRIVEYLLGKLFEAHPKQVISVQREDPRSLLHMGAADSPDGAPPPPKVGDRSGPVHDDYFVIDPQVSARTPNYVDTMAFRLVFSGQTSALRGFLNALAAPEIPLVVRSVEVEPNRDAEQRELSQRRRGPRDRRGIAESGAVAGDLPTIPIVAENISRFTVTVEMFVVKIRAPELKEVEGDDA